MTSDAIERQTHTGSSGVNGMTGQPALSVITATWNRPQWLRRALKSIAAQTYRDFEVIVVDDGSDNDTLARYEQIWKELDGRFILNRLSLSRSDTSCAASVRNRGLRAARGQFVAFCDDDDYWNDPDYLAVGVDMLKGLDADLFISNMRGENDEVVTIPSWFPNSPRMTRGRLVHQSPPVHELYVADLMAVMRHHYPHPNGCIVRKQLLGCVGYFDEQVRSGEDINFILRLADYAQSILYCPQPMVSFNVTPRDSSYSRRKNIDRWTYVAQGADRAGQNSRHVCVRRCARAIEAWQFRLMARQWCKEGQARQACRDAWRSCRLSPALGSVVLLAKTCVAAVLKGR